MDIRLFLVHCLYYWRRFRRWLLIEWRLHLVLAALSFLGGAAFAWAADDAGQFARAGSIMSLMGALMTFRRFLRGAEDEYQALTGAANQPAAGFLPPMEAMMDAPAQDRRAYRWGIRFAVVGTLIWGYGDLLLKAVGFCQT
jgi:hypothetical protein